ncbi:ABC transporter permease [Trichothermofontia sp.]
MNRFSINRFLYRGMALIGAVVLIALSILLVGASPWQVGVSLWEGAFGTPDQFARVLATLAPLVLCASGLVFTFTAGLYNLGIEGQVMVGAIATTGILRLLAPALPASLVVFLGILGGAIGGSLWGLFTGWLNVFGKVNEIFAGLGLNFVAQGLALYLIFGPWKRPGVASMSGTELFEPSLWLGTIGKTAASPVALILAGLALMATWLVMRSTYLGLRLRAVGKNLRAAYILGIPATTQLLSAFALCGALAGLAGALQVTAVFHRLIPNISSGLGFLALLIVLLTGSSVLWILPVAFFFSALNIGSLQLPLSLKLESSLAGVIQGTLVLLALLGRGWDQRRQPTPPPP